MFAAQLFGTVDLVVACVIGLFVVITLIAGIPDLIKYMKISSM
jgi:hypothetical protein